MGDTVGFRGALRYTEEPDVFDLELDAIGRVWEAGHTNFHVMLPFVRTARELERCRQLIAQAGLLDLPGFELWVMAEVPSVLFNLERYAELGVAGISIGSNDLTQLLLGADRDSEMLAGTFDERDPAMLEMLRLAVTGARRNHRKVGICGEAPANYPEISRFLAQIGIDSISVNPSSLLRTIKVVREAELGKHQLPTPEHANA